MEEEEEEPEEELSDSAASPRMCSGGRSRHLGCVSEGSCLLAVQQQRLPVEVVLQAERGSVPQPQVRVLDQLRGQQPGEVKHLADLRAGLDGARPPDAHVVHGLARADAQGVDQVACDQDTWADRRGR